MMFCAIQLQLFVKYCHIYSSLLFNAHNDEIFGRICFMFGDRVLQWLKYKFGDPGALKKFGALLSAERGPSQPVCTTNACVGPGNARQQFLGAQERRSAAFPLL